ncbi:MAG: hypothetical protein ABSA86_10280 [Oryzomonas sp.]
MDQVYAMIARCALLLLSIFFTGCTHLALPVTGSLPKGAVITRVSRVNAQAPFALDVKGETVAFVNDGLRIRELVSGSEWIVNSGTPTALAWSPDGKQLAAAFAQENDAVLRLYERQGNVVAEKRLPGRVNGLAWRSAQEILAFAMLKKQYSFGANLTELLYRWDGKVKPTATRLYDTTLKPTTLKQLDGILERTLTFSLSPGQDEILYIQMHDPPVFSTFMKLVLRHLESGKEREIAEIPVGSAGGIFSSDGERILYGNGEAGYRQMDTWGNSGIAVIPTPGQEIARSFSGRYLLLAGHLYRDGVEIASFPAATTGRFAAQAGRLSMVCGEQLYLVSGLPEELPPAVAPAAAEHLRKLRTSLSEGLISPQEYHAVREKLTR